MSISLVVGVPGKNLACVLAWCFGSACWYGMDGVEIPPIRHELALDYLVRHMKTTA
jgi:hypothetical protein